MTGLNKFTYSKDLGLSSTTHASRGMSHFVEPCPSTGKRACPQRTQQRCKEPRYLVLQINLTVLLALPDSLASGYSIRAHDSTALQ